MAVESDEADSRGRAQYAIRDAPDENEARFTVEEAVEKAGFGRFQWRLSILTGMAWMADAMELMILSIIAPALRCEWKLDSWKEALVSTVVFVGMMCSSAFWGKLCDRHGRRSGLVLAVAFVSYIGVLSAFAPTYPWILILRGCVGFGVGGVPQSVTEFKEAFTMIDQNRDGFVDIEDLHDMLASLGKDPSQDYLERMVAEAPGPINFTMFLTMFGEKLNGTDPEDVIRNAFACFDDNNSGKLNEEYLRELLMTTGDRYTEDQVDELLREAPIDANGDFDYIEFVKILKNGKVDPDANRVEMVKLE